jgi:hypothetical protein
MGTTARLAISLVAAASVATVVMMLTAWRHARREQGLRDEAVRRAQRRATLAGQWDPFDEANRALLQYERPPLRWERAAVRAVLAGALVGVIVFIALPARLGEGDNALLAANVSPVATMFAPTNASPAPRASTSSATPIPTEATVSPTTATPSTDAFAPESLVIANTGGIGVWVRTACKLSARTNEAWDEGQVVQTAATEIADCAGWRLVELRGVSSWVEERYLQPAPPP